MAATFIQDCIAGKATAEEIDDYVDAWHNGASDKETLHEHLGMLEAEYKAWVSDDSVLGTIIERYKQQ